MCRERAECVPSHIAEAYVYASWLPAHGEKCAFRHEKGGKPPLTHHRIARRARGPLSAALLGGVILSLVTGATPASATTAVPGVSCTSGKAGLAAKLSKDINAALKNRTATTAIAFDDRTTGTTCALRGTQRYDSASVVKVTVLATLLWDAQKTNRPLTKRETGLATAMITKSDNAATTKLWKQLGAAKVNGFLKAAGMTRTTPGADGYWGLTQITAGDEQRLLSLITGRNRVLTDASRAFILDRMHKVIPSQRWGVPAGAPSSATTELKNGWLQRDTQGWRVHSIGAFTGKGHDYRISVLTQNNNTMQDGVNTIEAVSRAVHKDLTAAAS